MIEKVYQITKRTTKTIERVIADDHVHFMHMILPKGEGLPIHLSNANLYMSVLKGVLAIDLNDQGIHYYEVGTILNIPLGIKMDVHNEKEEVLELFVIKTPVPGSTVNQKN